MKKTPPPPLWHRSLELLRRADRSTTEHLANLVEASNSFSPLTRFRVRNTGWSFKEFEVSPDSVARAFEESRRSRGKGADLPFVLGTERKNPRLVLSWSRDSGAARGGYDRVEVNFSLDRPLVGNGGLFNFTALMKYVAVCVDAFDAATASIHESRLWELVRSTFAREMSEAQLPKKDHKYIPVSEVVRITPPALVARLSRLRHPASFDVTKIPPAVFWVNYWNARQMERVGQERIRAAPWAFIAAHPRGGLVLATQKQEFDGLDVDHLERVATINDMLDLSAVQGGKRGARSRA